MHVPRLAPEARFAGVSLALLGAAITAAGALNYVDITPGGTGFPMWESGHCELEFADMNGDGHVDLISLGDHSNPSTYQHGVMVYFTDGAGGWTIHQEGNFGYGGIAAGDANNDGLTDIGYGIHHNYSSTDLGNQLIEVALGDGTGTSWTPWDDGLATNGETWGMAATEFADFDNDGLLDLVSVSMGCCNGVRVYRNNGDGTWTQTFALTGGNADWCVCTGDIDGDGNADFAASLEYGCVFLGDGEGGFVPGNAGLPGRYGLSLGDIDGDGCQDIACAQGGRVLAALWRTDHWEAALTGLPVSGGYDATQLIDMNSDGFVDLVALGDGTCSVWLGDGTGAWTAAGGLTGPVGRTVQAFRAGGDLDHNGYPDIAFVQEEGNWPSYHNELYVYRESSAPAARFVRNQFPRGHETFYLGSAQVIRWAAARVGTGPAAVTLALSYGGPAGPWHTIAESLPDNGRHQWIVAGGLTEEAYLRVTLTQGGQSVSDISGPFTLASTNPAAALTEPATRLWQIRPQPARHGVHFALPQVDGNWVIRIFDAGGRMVRVLSTVNGTAEWDGTDRDGQRIPAGIYTVRPWRGSGPEPKAQRLVWLR